MPKYLSREDLNEWDDVARAYAEAGHAAVSKFALGVPTHLLNWDQAALLDCVEFVDTPIRSPGEDDVSCLKKTISLLTPPAILEHFMNIVRHSREYDNWPNGDQCRSVINAISHSFKEMYLLPL
jgi:hypothetical protein